MRDKPNFLVGILGENYAWAVCAACLLVLLCSGGLTYKGFAAYQPYLISSGGLTNTQSSMLITIRSFTILVGF